jgi:hypothetical protein
MDPKDIVELLKEDAAARRAYNADKSVKLECINTYSTVWEDSTNATGGHELSRRGEVFYRRKKDPDKKLPYGVEYWIKAEEKPEEPDEFDWNDKSLWEDGYKVEWSKGYTDGFHDGNNIQILKPPGESSLLGVAWNCDYGALYFYSGGDVRIVNKTTKLVGHIVRRKRTKEAVRYFLVSKSGSVTIHSSHEAAKKFATSVGLDIFGIQKIKLTITEGEGLDVS